MSQAIDLDMNLNEAVRRLNAVLTRHQPPARHGRLYRANRCTECGFSWPCPTAVIIQDGES